MSSLSRRRRFRHASRIALAFQQHLTQPATQARIRAFRVSGIDGPIFWPAGNQNDN